MADAKTIPAQKPVPWLIALEVSWAGLRRRFLRSLITMSGVVFAIAFLSYMLTVENVTKSLVEHNDNELNIILQEAGVNVMDPGAGDAMMYLLLGLSLVTCTVGILNSMLMSVTERVREIGTLKCLGAGDMFIIKTYFIESSLQGLCGAALGLVLGLAVALVILMKTYKQFVFMYFPWLDVTKALGISFLCGTLISVVAAIAPAYLAARKQPVDALRVDE